MQELEIGQGYPDHSYLLRRIFPRQNNAPPAVGVEQETRSNISVHPLYTRDDLEGCNG